jgi:transposase
VQAGYAIAFLDESIFALVPHLTKGWFVIGSRPTKKIINNPHQKKCVFGAMFNDKIITKISTTINSKKFLAFLKRLHKSHKKLCIILDNARWHLTRQVLEFARKVDMKFIRLLAYSPELNPIEQYWQNVKKWLGTRMWFSIYELEKQLRIAFRKNDLLPKINGY